MHISENLQKLIFKKIKAFNTSDAKNLPTVKRQSIEPVTTFLKDIKVPFMKKITSLLIAVGILLLYFTRIFGKTSNEKFILMYSLTKEQVLRDNSLFGIHSFLKTKKINLNEKNKVLIECREIWRTRKFSNITATLDIPLEIFATSFTFKERINLLITFFCRISNLIKSFRNSQYIYLVFKEYIYDENVYTLGVHKKQVIKIITTPGNWQYQPIIFEMQELIGDRLMIWYSNALFYKSRSKTIDNQKLEFERFSEHVQIDTHWVWTKKHRDYLKRLTNSKIVVKGSMLFYNPPLKVNNNKKYDITVFDTTPQAIEEYKDTINTYHCTKNFIEEILASANFASGKLNRDISVYIKPKRQYGKIHSKEYIVYLQEQIRNNRLFRLRPDIDIYETVLASRVVIGFPFTSPVIIGQELKIPSVYYLSSDIVFNCRQSSFIQSRHGLEKFLIENLRS